ncbi:prefoldin subunit 4-like [Halichondria panicea]|uniref:prefoldin subunit 4-like n=1 Tax=Halichondria panicea TaxID=6063 RepID=UPI00312BA40D
MATLSVNIPSGTATKDIQEVNVSHEDQTNINKFARGSLRLNELAEEIKEKEKELQNLEEAGDELMLADDDEPAVLKVGEVFMQFPNEEVQESVEEAKTALKEGVDKLRESRVEIKKTLAALKVQLYAKFGDNINLEDESDS